jgi:hypothetical protein
LSRRESAFASAGVHSTLIERSHHPNFPQKYFENVAGFLEKKNHHPKPTWSPAIHHKFTTKNHHKTACFLKNP